MSARIAIITDVHADVHAVRDALAQIERLACDLVVCAGDLVDYGRFPEETIELLAERQVPCIRGNHDRWAVARDRSAMSDTTGRGLSEGAVEFLARLPTSWHATIEGVRVVVHHASPRSDMQGIFPDEATVDDARRWLSDAKADVLLVGHTHVAFALRVFGGGLLANPGALLRDAEVDRGSENGAIVPGPRHQGGTFGVLELPARRFSVHCSMDGEEVEIPRTTLGVSSHRNGGLDGGR